MRVCGVCHVHRYIVQSTTNMAPCAWRARDGVRCISFHDKHAHARPIAVRRENGVNTKNVSNEKKNFAFV